MPIKFFLVLISLLLCFPLHGLSQTKITGYVRDAETKEVLPAANIQIIGTLRGTITNNDGRFQLEVEHLPTALLISYIGYESKKIIIESSDADKLQNILLNPVILEAETIVVSAEDPAMNIMRKVIEKKQQWRKELETYRAKAYSRLILKNDSGIVSIAESISEAFWHKEKGPREVIKTKRQTSNMNAEGNFATVSYIPNFYDDDIEINGFRIIGPTHPSALEYYRFKLTGRRMRDSTVVYDIEVIPTSRLQPTFVGHIAVLDKAYAMIEVDLKPNDTILFPPPIQEWNLFYEQQFSNFGKDFWLPVDVRIGGRIKVGFTGLQFPAISYSQLSHLNDYQINIDLPDSLYQEEKIFSIDSTSLDADTLFVKSPEVVPLSTEEETAYDTLDSTMTIAKAFEPTGFLSRFVETESNADRETSDGSGASLLSGFGPQLWFNRVDGFNAGITCNKQVIEPLKTRWFMAYKSGPQRWAYGGRLIYVLDRKQTTHLSVEYRRGSRRQFASDNYSMTLVSPLPLLALDDYFHYYWNNSFRSAFSHRFRNMDLTVTAGYNDEWHSNLKKTTDFNMLGSHMDQRDNRVIEPGHLRSFDLSLKHGERVPFGVIGERYVEMKIEHSTSGVLSSDYNFTRYLLNMDWRMDTFLRRRLLPNALDIRLTLATSTGDLPVQRFTGIDGNLHGFAPFGTFRTLVGQPYLGEDMAGVFWEHNFRTVPFELLGIDYLARKGLSIIVHGAHGRTWIDTERLEQNENNIPYLNRIHHELGVSLNSIFGMLRIDGTWRLDRPGFYLSAGFARFF